MDLTILKDFNKSVWYRGSKILKVEHCDKNMILFSNKDTFKQVGSKFFINDILMSTIPDLKIDELLSIYFDFLQKRGYKFLNV